MPGQLISQYAAKTANIDDSILSRINSFDWSTTTAGEISKWPEELKTAVRMTMMSVTAAVVFLGRAGVILPNKAAMDMLGEHYHSMLGRPVGEVFPEAAEFFEHVLDECFKGSGTRVRDEPLRLLRNGIYHTGWFNSSFTPISDKNGTISGVHMTIAETTERVRNLKALRQTRERMDMALDAGGVLGLWDLDIENNELTVDGVLRDMFGTSDEIGTGHKTTIEELIALIHPEDRISVLSSFDEARLSETEFRSRFRISGRDGDELWLISIGRPMPDREDGKRQFAGLILDVTEQTQALEALQESQLRFDILAEAVPQIVWSADESGNRDYFNRRWLEFTGIEANQSGHMGWENLIHQDDVSNVMLAWNMSLKSGMPYDMEYRCHYQQSHYRWVREMATPVLCNKGMITRWYGIITDIDDAKQEDAYRAVVASELDHRIKNLFALTNALMSLSVRDAPDMRPLADLFLGRLTALHHAHELIYDREDKTSKSIKELLIHMLKPYEASQLQGPFVEGDNPQISARVFTSIALIIHELLTNSVKYGALGCLTEGRLNIHLRTLDTGLMISWNENFSTNRTTVPSTGFGSEMLNNIIEKQLRGTIKRELADDGLALEIHLPSSIINVEII